MRVADQNGLFNAPHMRLLGNSYLGRLYNGLAQIFPARDAESPNPDVKLERERYEQFQYWCVAPGLMGLCSRVVFTA